MCDEYEDLVRGRRNHVKAQSENLLTQEPQIMGLGIVLAKVKENLARLLSNFAKLEKVSATITLALKKCQ